MRKSFIFFVFFVITCNALFAVPAYPHPITLTQPDGATVVVMIKGDERIHWHETMDGYTLLYNQDGYLTYAQLDGYGNLQPSDVIATNVDDRDVAVGSYLNTIEKELFYSDIQKQLMLQVWEIEDEYETRAEKAVIGTYKTLCAFVQFPEKAMTLPMSAFENLMNQLGYTGNGTGSVRDFFKEASYNQFDLEITLCGIYTAPNSEAYYAGSGGTQNCQALGRWAAQQVAAEPGINFADYDSNNNGVVDGFHFIFAGRGQEAGGGAGTIWSHKWQFSPAVTKNGKSISVYSCSPELLYGNITTIGVICHEMTHAFGAPDFYDTNGSTGGQYEGTGQWDLMAGGSWNGSPGGNCPPHHNMYTKVQFGWVTPVVLNSPTTILSMPNSAQSPVAYRINTATNNEHYLLENRQKTKFDSYVPGAGLLIYHVHSNVGTSCINCTHQQKMYPVCASRTSTQMPTAGASNYGNINSAGCPFPGTSNKTTFTDNSAPPMKSWANANMNKPITNITHTSGLISFDFMGGTQTTYYTITATAGDNGTIQPSGMINVNQGSNQIFTATPNNCQEVDQWTVNGTVVQNGGTTYTIQNIQENTTISVTFKTIIYTITPSAGSGGTISPSDDQTVNCGSNQTFTATPNSCIEVDQWTVNGNVVQNGGTTYTIQNIQANTTIGVTFKTITYTITPWAGDGGDISPTDVQTVDCEGDQIFTATPNSCHEIDQWTVNGTVVQTGGTTYTIQNIQENTTIDVTFKMITYTITPSAGNGGDISPSDVQTVDCEGDQTFTATPNSCHEIDQWTVNGTVVQTGGTTYTIQNIQENTTIDVTFKTITYTITASANPPEGGTVVGAGDTDIPCGTSVNVTVTATANTDYTFVNWTINGVEVSTDIICVYYFTVVEDVELIANFEESVVGIEQLQVTSYELQVYPNPTTGELQVSLPNPSEGGAYKAWEEMSIEVFDVFGRNVGVKFPSFGGVRGGNISHLPPGIYFIRIQTENEVVTRKVIKN